MDAANLVVIVVLFVVVFQRKKKKKKLIILIINITDKEKKKLNSKWRLIKNIMKKMYKLMFFRIQLRKNKNYN